MMLFRTFINSIADAGRELLEGRSIGAPKSKDMVSLCLDLITQKGEALGTALAREVVKTYKGLDDAHKKEFFFALLSKFDVDEAQLAEAIKSYQEDPSPATAHQISIIAESRRQGVIRGINMAPGGTGAIIKIREDLLKLLREYPELRTVDADFAHLLSSWFNRGFLELRRISWSTPANVLEKLIAYEAVHEIRDWNDLRRRLDDDRRCYAFFHPALPNEPLIFVEVALVNGLSGSVQELLDDTAGRITDKKSDTAIFYSISNCQEGLKGISFGNFLIKQVVSELQQELPNLKTFSTLSPIPGFARWVEAQSEDTPEVRELLDRLNQDNWYTNPVVSEELKTPLMQLCAGYLVNEKRKNQPLNAVARFHLGNGAQLERINWLGDVSKKGLDESFALLVNYKYDLAKIESNHEAYANDGTVTYSRAIEKLLADANTPTS